MKPMFTLTSYYCLTVGWHHLSSGVQGWKGLKFQKKNIWVLFKLFEKWLSYKLRGFSIVFNILNIDNFRTIRGKSIEMDTNKNVVKLFSKFFEKGNVYL